jgi:hypothetical protein
VPICQQWRRQGSNDIGRTFVVADLPGWSKARTRRWLGIRFLRHVERTRLLVHLIDTSDFTDATRALPSKSSMANFARSMNLLAKTDDCCGHQAGRRTDRARLGGVAQFCASASFTFTPFLRPPARRAINLAIADARQNSQGDLHRIRT